MLCVLCLRVYENLATTATITAATTTAATTATAAAAAATITFGNRFPANHARSQKMLYAKLKNDKLAT